MPTPFHRPLVPKTTMYDFKRNTKPVKDVEKLIKALLPFSQRINLKSKERFELVHDGKNMCWMLLKGSLTIKRITDDLIISQMSPPAIMGLALVAYPSPNLYLHFDSDSEIATIAVDELESIIDEHQLWKCVASVQAHITQVLVIRDSTVVVKSAYEVVCNQLRYLMEESLQIRGDVTVTNYILKRTHISRSSIVKILRQLQDGGYIVMEDSKLVAINILPERY